ncbi:protein ZNRD2 isoform X2 [Hyla sarda]|uniref:protein ZNRD2 isoform X2 n=1 Tax=Hyla sarda TaxID=327740 RepID=UPI0024C32A6A|nr:protein ZNRD2 isoform X2 [Hyla sarda]
MALHDDDTWSPPSESDLKIIRAQRERQDKISRMMGDYLLKGYRMLGDCCETCGTILLQDRQKKLLCISCQELDSDTEKDNPVLNPQAALSQVREHQLSLHERPVRDVPAVVNPVTNPKPGPVHAAVVNDVPQPIVSAENALLEKLSWATHQLKEASSVEYSAQLCALIGTCAQTLKSLRDLRH